MKYCLFGFVYGEGNCLTLQIASISDFIGVVNAFVYKLPNKLLGLVNVKQVIPIKINFKVICKLSIACRIYSPVVFIEFAGHNFEECCVLLLLGRDGFAFDILWLFVVRLFRRFAHISNPTLNAFSTQHKLVTFVFLIKYFKFEYCKWE